MDIVIGILGIILILAVLIGFFRTLWGSPPKDASAEHGLQFNDAPNRDDYQGHIDHHTN